MNDDRYAEYNFNHDRETEQIFDHGAVRPTVNNNFIPRFLNGESNAANNISSCGTIPTPPEEITDATSSGSVSGPSSEDEMGGSVGEPHPEDLKYSERKIQRNKQPFASHWEGDRNVGLMEGDGSNGACITVRQPQMVHYDRYQKVQHMADIQRESLSVGPAPHRIFPIPSANKMNIPVQPPYLSVYPQQTLGPSTDEANLLAYYHQQRHSRAFQLAAAADRELYKRRYQYWLLMNASHNHMAYPTPGTPLPPSVNPMSPGYNGYIPHHHAPPYDGYHKLEQEGPGRERFGGEGSGPDEAHRGTHINVHNHTRAAENERDEGGLKAQSKGSYSCSSMSSATTSDSADVQGARVSVGGADSLDRRLELAHEQDMRQLESHALEAMMHMRGTERWS